MTTTAVVKEGGKETKTPETLGLICNVAIVQHKGKLQTRWGIWCFLFSAVFCK